MGGRLHGDAAAAAAGLSADLPPPGPTSARTVHWHQGLVLAVLEGKCRADTSKCCSRALSGAAVPLPVPQTAAQRGDERCLQPTGQRKQPVLVYFKQMYNCCNDTSDLIPQDIFCIYLESRGGKLLSHCLPCSGPSPYSLLAGAGRTSWVLFGKVLLIQELHDLK